MTDLVERIVSVLRALETADRRAVSAEVGCQQDSVEFRLAFNAAIEALWQDGVCFRAVGAAGAYRRLVGVEGALAMLKQAQGRVRAAHRKLAKSNRQAATAPAMTDDEHVRAALQRQVDRTSMMIAVVGAARRTRKFG